ncbi:unnamed protein product [Parajaminaea phylloscopi]
MDPVLTDVQGFYQYVEHLLDQPLEVPEAFRHDVNADVETKTHAALFERIQLFFDLLESCFDRFLEHQYNLDYCTSRLLQAPFFREHHDEAATCIIDLTARAKSVRALLIAYEFILAYGSSEPSIFRSIHDGVNGMAKDKIARLVHQIWAGHYAATAEASLGRLKPSIRHHASISPQHTSDWHEPYPDREHPVQAGESENGNPIAVRLASQPIHTTAPLASSSSTSGWDAARTRLHQMKLREKAIQMLYEVCRVQRLDATDMRAVDTTFISHLFDLVEDTRHHEDEAFNYQLIKLISALNEQFMVSSISQQSSSGSSVKDGPTKNLVMSILRTRLHVTKTFGENVIFMLNRASSHSAEDTCMQLLVLKLLYLLFTTQDTAHYFYTNDLKVLVDVFIRELSDLPEESESLRHTYLRVLHPLLTNTQLYTSPYKRPQIRRLLKTMVTDSLYHGEVSATTRRLVQRCLDAEWNLALDRLDASVDSRDEARVPASASDPARESASTAEQRSLTLPSEPDRGVVPEDPSLNEPRTPATEQDGAILSMLQSSRLRGSSFSVPEAEITGTCASEEGAEPHCKKLTDRLRHDLLSAPRFRSASAHSAPTTPPPLLPHDPVEGRDGLVMVHAEPEDETAIALADGRTSQNCADSPSWQSQVVTDPTHEQAHSRRGSTEEGRTLSSGHRPITRRASHNEFKPPLIRPASRRAPPPAPSNASRHDESSRAAFKIPMHADVERPRQTELPSVRQSGQSRTRPDGLPNDDGNGLPFPPPSFRVPGTVQPGAVAGTVASGSSSPGADEQEGLTRSLESLTSGRHRVSSLGGSPLRVETPTSAAMKQRRRPPAPPGASSASHDSVHSVASLSTLATSPPTSSEFPTDGPTLMSRAESCVASEVDHRGAAIAVSSAPGDVQDGNSDGTLRSGTPSSASSRRRPPPPPPVNRATKPLRCAVLLADES